ncbi:hypothetical protein PanNE5_15880 [Pandoraea sp. NE5]|uniref:hypothetical protein n=1 Tax=Pandoraea sp. NE5 TaxID=2904129 RepID=UPI0021C25914|nr:hypothetical protein [Pandoraea sp. NE5]BDD92148.1 hypothetical protein PanNE5_15880 [Pandoraea sp. NE5]
MTQGSIFIVLALKRKESESSEIASSLSEWGASAAIVSVPAEDVQDTFSYALHLAQAEGKHSWAKPLKGFGGATAL